MTNDFFYALRSIRRTPVFAAAAIVTLALGIGANTAIFSLIHALLLRTLPLESPHELYFVAHGAGDDFSQSANFPWFERVQQRSDVFAGVTAYNHGLFKVSSDGGVERVMGQYVSGNYHALLGVPMALGRGFSAENDRAAGSSPIAVISYDYWSRRFGRSPSVLNETLAIGRHVVSIVGVTQSGFAGLAPGDAIDITLPLSMRVLDEPDFPSWSDGWLGMPIVVRLRDGVGMETAAEALASSYRQYMSEPFNVDFRRTPDGRPTTATLVSAARGDDDLRVEYATALQALMGMVGLVLLIVCVNVASLLIVRATARARDVAVRMAVGASRWRLLAPFIAESLILSLAGGGIGLLLAGWGLEFISGLLRGGTEPVVVDVRPDVAVLLFTIVVAVVVGIAFGIGPALAGTRIDPVTAMKGATGTSRSGWRAREVMVAAQVSLSLVIVFSAGLLVRTLVNLRAIEGGFVKEGVVVFALDARDTRLEPERLAPLCAEIVARLNDRPDVQAGACSTMSPIDPHSTRRAFTIDGTPRPDSPPAVYTNSVDAGYFATLGVTLVRGRALEPRDTTGPASVAVISEAMARRYFGGTDPVGRTIRWGWRDPGPPITIVGVVGDTRLSLREAPPEMVYTPLGPSADPPQELLAAIRSNAVSRTLISAVRDQVRGASPEIALTYLRSMDEQIEAALVSERLLATLSSAFAVLALVLACVGLYGVLAYDVSRRTQEIGIRLALGANRRTVLGAVLRRTAFIVGAGVAVGLLAASFASQVVSRLVYGLEASDPLTLVAAASVLAATAMLAGYFPARRAARIDPVRALRTE